MKVIVKMLQGEEYCNVEISSSESVLELKSKVEGISGVEAARQKLIWKGKALADKNPLSFYPGIKDDSRIYLVVKKEPASPGDGKPKIAPKKSGICLLKDEISRILRRYYTPAETESITNELVKDLQKKVEIMSFDDLERLATALLQDEEIAA